MIVLFLCNHKKRGSRGEREKGGGASEPGILLQTSRLFHDEFFFFFLEVGGGRKPATFFPPSTLSPFLCTNRNKWGHFGVVWGCAVCRRREGAKSSDNEGIRQDRAEIAREGQEEKSSGRGNFVAPRRFSSSSSTSFSPHNVALKEKLRSSRKLSDISGDLGFFFFLLLLPPLLFFGGWISFVKMSSQARGPIVGLCGMLCLWAACLSGCGAVLSPNATIFQDRCKKTTTCEVLKYNTCLGSPLPYTHTSLVLAEDSSTQEEAFEKLTMWSGKLLNDTK